MDALDAYLKVIFGLEYLKLAGASLRVAMLPDFILDLDLTDFVDRVSRYLAEPSAHSMAHWRMGPRTDNRLRRPGGHATIASLAVQMLHRPEFPLFDLTYIAKTGRVGRAYMEEFLVEQVRGHGFPFDLSFCRTDGQDRITRVYEKREGDQPLFRGVQAIDPETELRWSDLAEDPAGPVRRLSRADAIGLFAPKSRISRELMAHLSDPQYLEGGSLTGRGVEQVILVDATNLHQWDPGRGIDEAQSSMWRSSQWVIDWIDTLGKAGREAASSHQALVLLVGAREAEFILERDRGGMRTRLEALARRLNCPVVFYDERCSCLVDPGRVLGGRDFESCTAVQSEPADLQILNGRRDCFSGGLLLALGVRGKLRNCGMAPSPLQVPSLHECLLMGHLVEAAYLKHGRHPDAREMYKYAAAGQHVLTVGAVRAAIEKDTAEVDPCVDASVVGDSVQPDVPEPTAAVPTTSPASPGPVSLAQWTKAIQEEILYSRMRHDPVVRDPLIAALSVALQRVWNSSAWELAPEAVADIWASVDACDTSSMDGRLLLSGFLYAISLDVRFGGRQRSGSRHPLAPTWAPDVGREGGAVRTVVFVDLDGTLFENPIAWEDSILPTLAKLRKDLRRRFRDALGESDMELFRKHIYDQHPFFRAWSRTACDTRQVWMSVPHLIGFVALQDLSPEDRSALKAAMVEAVGQGDRTAVDSYIDGLPPTHVLRQFSDSYTSAERDVEVRIAAERAKDVFDSVPWSPYPDAVETVHFLTAVAGMDLYVCSEGDERYQTQKLRKLGLLGDGPAQFRPGRVLTTQAAAYPDELLGTLAREIDRLNTDEQKADVETRVIARAQEWVNAWHHGGHLSFRIYALAEELLGQKLTSADRRVENVIEQVCVRPHDELVEELKTRFTDATGRMEKCRLAIGGLKYIEEMFRFFSRKATGPGFYVRCIQAVQQDAESPVRHLHKFELLPQSSVASLPPLRLAMIGDNFDRDIKPLHRMNVSGPGTGRRVTTFRLLAGKYRNDSLEKHEAGMPTFSVYSLSEFLQGMLQERTWGGASPLQRMALPVRLPDTRERTRGFVLALQLKDSKDWKWERPIGDAIRDGTDLVFEEYRGEKDRNRAQFKRLLVSERNSVREGLLQQTMDSVQERLNGIEDKEER